MFAKREVLFHKIFYYWPGDKENRSLNRGPRYIEVCYIEVPLYYIRRLCRVTLQLCIPSQKPSEPCCYKFSNSPLQAKIEYCTFTAKRDYTPLTLRMPMTLDSFFCIVNKMETRMIGNSFSFTICTPTVMYLVCLPTFGITFTCFLIVPGY